MLSCHVYWIRVCKRNAERMQRMREMSSWRISKWKQSLIKSGTKNRMDMYEESRGNQELQETIIISRVGY